MSGNWITFILVFGFIIATALFTYFVPVLHWYMASQAGINLSIIKLIKLRFSGYSLDILIDNLIKIREYDLPFTLEELLAHSDKGGNIDNLVKGMVYAREYNIPVTKRAAVRADLSKVDISKGVIELTEKKLIEEEKRRAQIKKPRPEAGANIS